jgi:hypothetical protein
MSESRIQCGEPLVLPFDVMTSIQNSADGQRDRIDGFV